MTGIKTCISLRHSVITLQWRNNRKNVHIASTVCSVAFAPEVSLLLLTALFILSSSTQPGRLQGTYSLRPRMPLPRPLVLYTNWPWGEAAIFCAAHWNDHMTTNSTQTNKRSERRDTVSLWRVLIQHLSKRFINAELRCTGTEMSAREVLALRQAFNGS